MPNFQKTSQDACLFVFGCTSTRGNVTDAQSAAWMLKGGLSNARNEATNNKIKSLIRIAYGFRDSFSLKSAIFGYRGILCFCAIAAISSSV